MQQLLTKIIYYLCLLDGVLTLILVIAALIRGQNVIEMLPFLAMMFIASIPVAMPSTFALSNSFEATRLSKEGVLTSDLTGIQDAANLNLLLLDKTGTITENKTAVSQWDNLSSLSNKKVLALVGAATDKRSPSIIDSAIDEYLKEKGITPDTPEKFIPFTSDTGYSMATVGSYNIKLGSFKQLSLIDKNADKEVKNIDFTAGRSVAVLINDKLAGIFILRDKVRSDSKKALEELKSVESNQLC